MRDTLVTLSIGPTRYSFGYQWHLAVSDQTLKDDAEREASLEGIQADVIALRAGSGHAQFGLGWLKANDRRKGSVAAIAFASIQAKHTARKAIGLFDIGPMWWFCVIDDDLIHDETDRVFHNLSEALEAFSGALSKKHWDRIYFPDDLLQNALARRRGESAERHAARQADQTDEILYLRTVTESSVRVITTPLGQLLADVDGVFHTQRRLRRFDVLAGLTSRTALSAYGVMVIMLAIAGWKPIYQKYFQPKPLSVAAKPAPPAPAPAPAPAITFVDTPMPPIAPPGAFVSQCLDILSRFESRLPSGWSALGLECDGTAATLRTSRSGGTIEDLEHSWADARYSYSEDYGEATVTLPLHVEAAPLAGPLEEAEALRRRLYALGWSTEENLTVSAFAPPQGRLPIDRAAWRLASVQIDTQTDPREWAKVLDRIPGLTLSALTLRGDSLTNLRWHIRGLIYAAH